MLIGDIVVITALLVVAALVGAGCSSGQLQQTNLGTADPTGGAASADVNAPIAVGATIPLSITAALQGGTAVPLSLRTVDSAVAIVDDTGKIRGVGPGITAVLIMAEDDGVLDLTHVSVQKANRLSLHRIVGEVDARELPDVIQLFPGEELDLHLGVWHDGQPLLGDIGDEWSADNGDFLVVNQGFPLQRRLRAPAAGSTELVVDALGLTRTIRFEVVQ